MWGSKGLVGDWHAPIRHEKGRKRHVKVAHNDQLLRPPEPHLIDFILQLLAIACNDLIIGRLDQHGLAQHASGRLFLGAAPERKEDGDRTDDYCGYRRV